MLSCALRHSMSQWLGTRRSNTRTTRGHSARGRTKRDTSDTRLLDFGQFALQSYICAVSAPPLLSFLSSRLSAGKFGVIRICQRLAANSTNTRKRRAESARGQMKRELVGDEQAGVTERVIRLIFHLCFRATSFVFFCSRW